MTNEVEATFPTAGVSVTLTYQDSDSTAQQILQSFRAVARMKRCLLLLVVAIAVALAACKPPPPPPPPPAPAAAPSPSAGFDACAAPSTSVDDRVEGVAVHERRHVHRRRQPRLLAAEPDQIVGSARSPARAGGCCPSGSDRRRPAPRSGAPRRSLLNPGHGSERVPARRLGCREHGAGARVRVAGAGLLRHGGVSARRSRAAPRCRTSSADGSRA